MKWVSGKAELSNTVRGKPGADNGIQGANTLCEECIRATGGCEWSDSFQPVPGWTVEKGKYPSWVHILKCPKFEKGDRLWTKEKRLNANASLITS